MENVLIISQDLFFRIDLTSRKAKKYVYITLSISADVRLHTVRDLRRSADGRLRQHDRPNGRQRSLLFDDDNDHRNDGNLPRRGAHAPAGVRQPVRHLRLLPADSGDVPHPDDLLPVQSARHLVGNSRGDADKRRQAEGRGTSPGGGGQEGKDDCSRLGSEPQRRSSDDMRQLVSVSVLSSTGRRSARPEVERRPAERGGRQRTEFSSPATVGSANDVPQHRNQTAVCFRNGRR